jgi:putative aldouronate transport system substrate-binding protein
MMQTHESSKDAQEIVAHINALGYDYRVEIIFESMYTYHQASARYIATDTQLDIICGSVQGLLRHYREGNILPLNDLLESHGQGIMDVLNGSFLKVGRLNGQQYAVTTNRELARSYVYSYRKDLADQYGLYMDDVRSLDDLETEFGRLSAENGIIPVASYNCPDWDTLGDSLGVLMDAGLDTEVVNLYETERYREYVERVYRWRQRGWVVDTQSMSLTNTAYLRSSSILGSFGGGKPGFDVQETRSVGSEIRSVEIVPPFLTSSHVGGFMWAIAKNSEYPSLAMDFLNKTYTDETLYNLLTFGIEGKHYEFVDREQKIIDYPEGVDAQTSGYAQFLGWLYGNQDLSYIWNGNSPDLWHQTKQFREQAFQSAALGFVFDSAPMEGILRNCQAIQNKYVFGLENGYLDPGIYLDLFNRELYGAGLELIIQEKQSQLDAWAEAN